MGRSILLMDVDPYSGGVAVQLNLRRVEVPFTKTLLQELDVRRGIMRYEEGKFDVIAQTTSITPYAPSASQIERMAKHILGLGYDFIISDSAPGMLFKPVARFYNTFITVALPFSDSIEGGVRLVRRYERLGLDYSVVLNRVGSNPREEINKKKVEEILEHRVGLMIPEDPKVAESINAGKPLYLMDRRSGFSVAIEKLAKLYSKR